MAFLAKRKRNVFVQLCPELQSIFKILSLILVFDETLSSLKISCNHLFDEGVKVDVALPSKQPFSFCRIAEKEATDE